MFFLDKTGLEHLCTSILAKLSNKVDKVHGKGLSTNDYTDEDKNNLTNLNNLVGDTSVVDQIATATSNKKIKVSRLRDLLSYRAVRLLSSTV